MRKSTTFYILLLVLVFMFPSLMRSQSSMTSKDNWRPFKVQADNSNTLNGVSFFKKPLDCNAKEVIVFKIINLNAFDVKITWNIKNAKTFTILIPSKGNAGGSCETFTDPVNNDFSKSLALLKDAGVDENEILSSLKIEVAQATN